MEDLPEAHVPCGLLAVQAQEAHRQEGRLEGRQAGQRGEQASRLSALGPFPHHHKET